VCDKKANRATPWSSQIERAFKVFARGIATTKGAALPDKQQKPKRNFTTRRLYNTAAL
jgi:hypothetical protein